MTVQLPAPRAILFDWDNTLIDSMPIIHAALHETFETMGQTPWTLAETRQRTRFALRDSFPKLFGGEWERARDVFFAAFERVHLDNLRPFDAAGEMIRHIHDQGIYLGVISNKTGKYLRLEVGQLGWGSYFSRVVGAGDAERDKPSPEPVALALEGSGVASGPSVWMIGDSNVDMEIAYAADLTPVVLKHGDIADGEFAAYPPARIFEGCREVKAYFGS